jgi:hypothetical protein
MGAVASVEEATSPRKAFSLAMRGGWNVVCALSKNVNGIGAIVAVFSGVEVVLEAFPLDLLKADPMVNFWYSDGDSIAIEIGDKIGRRGVGREKEYYIHTLLSCYLLFGCRSC